MNDRVSNGSFHAFMSDINLETMVLVFLKDVDSVIVVRLGEF